MPAFHITVSRDRSEYLTFTIPADNKADALDLARNMEMNGQLDEGDLGDDWTVGDAIEDSAEFHVEEVPETRMFLITATDDDGNNRDEFIEAATPEAAVEMYRNTIAANGLNPATITHVFAVPGRTGEHCVVPWTEVEDHYQLVGG